MARDLKASVTNGDLPSAAPRHPLGVLAGGIRHPHLGARFCPSCGRVRAADDAAPWLCDACGHHQRIHPRPCTGTVAVADGRALLVRRDIEPRKGLWQVPGGFMEADEAPGEAARRELREEAGVEVGALDLLGVYSAVPLALFVVCYAGPALTPATVGHEVQEVGWFAPHAIPWEDISFTSSELALREWLRRQGIAVPPALRNSWGG